MSGKRSHPTPRYLRFCAYCRKHGKRINWLVMSYWIDAGEPR